MKKFIIMLLICAAVISGCTASNNSSVRNNGNVRNVENKAANNDSGTQKNMKPFEIRAEITKTDEECSVTYWFNKPEDISAGSVIINVYKLLKGKDPIPWGTHKISLEDNNKIYIPNGAYIESEYQDYSYSEEKGAGGGTGAVFMRVNGVPVMEQTGSFWGRVIAYNNLYQLEDLEATIGEEVVLGYSIITENRNLFQPFDTKYFFDTNSIPESKYWFLLFVVTMTVVPEE
ncbi:MAG: hypothetical protein IKI73_06930 [Firmicutes bacterium]|nr:hypothetical protein [Bacillota bacterium]